jgi:hypothetical protein
VPRGVERDGDAPLESAVCAPVASPAAQPAGQLGGERGGQLGGERGGTATRSRAAASRSVKLEPAPELDAKSGDDERKTELETLAHGN